MSNGPEVSLLVASGLVDLAWVSAQHGRELHGVEEAAALALDEELAPHPLLDPGLLPRASDADRSDRAALLAYLRDPGQRSPHPFLDATLVPDLLPDAAGTSGGLLARWLAEADDDPYLPTSALPRPVRLRTFRAAALAAAHAWRLEDGTTRVHGRAPGSQSPPISLVVPLPAGPRRVVDWLAGVSADDVEVVAVSAAAGRAAYVMAHLLTTLVERAVLVSSQGEQSATALLNLGRTHAEGAVVALARPDVQPTADDLRALAAAAAAPVAVAQPVITGPDGVVQSAGLVFTDDAPSLLLAGHPVADAARLGTTPVPAVAAGLVAARSEVLDALGGLDEEFEGRLAESDLGLRAAATGLGTTCLVGTIAVRGSGRYGPPPAVRQALRRLLSRHRPAPTDLDSLLAPAGLAAGPHPGGGRAGLAPLALRALRSVDEQPPRLRWAIDIAAPAGPYGDRWGDSHFAHSLAQNLEALGQHVAVDRREARHRATRSLDDVVVVLRGLDAVRPSPGPVSIQWLISHPDLVTPEELAAFDVRFAASIPWSRETSQRWGLRVDPLLQCTDPARFHPGPVPPDRATDAAEQGVLFVGNSRGQFRPVVRAALAAGADLRLHGFGWEQFVDPALVASQAVPNEELGVLYAGAGVVLADHHDDMRRDGFLANRLFDAAACGARVLSDDVEGIVETFGRQVLTFRDDQDVAGLLAPPWSAWPDVEERLALAAQVAAEHSFARRAQTLLEAALAVRASR